MDRELYLLKPFSFLGLSLMRFFESNLKFFKYLAAVFLTLFTPPLRIRETVMQMYLIGVKSTPIILFCVSFAAMVTIQEYAYHMNLVIHSTSLVPGFASLLVLRELGCVITALLLTSRVGAGITAELGTMKITEQIDALKLLGFDPFRFLIVPRLIATIFSSMALSVFANATSLLFSMLVSVQNLNYSMESFLTAMNRFTSFKDVIFALAKAAVFGAIIPLVSGYCGLECKGGADGVGKATTQSVVGSSVAIIISDFILTWIFSSLY
jgi:phospholipid/cholesterol/gamma-HCH transport system permease protein